MKNDWGILVFVVLMTALILGTLYWLGVRALP